MPSFEELTDEQRAALSRVGYQLIHNPEVSRDAKRLLMKANPKVKFPEIENEERTNAALKERDEKLQALEQKLLEKEMQDRVEAKRQQCRERGLDPAEVENLIVERGKQNRLIDFESAMELVEAQKQIAAATPSSQGPQRELSSIKELWENPGKWAREQTHAAIDELKKRRLRAV